jgi:hypothetical protein
MSTSYYADRINFSFLQQQHPDWSQQEYAAALHRSKSWVGKWQSRLRDLSTGFPQQIWWHCTLSP